MEKHATAYGGERRTGLHLSVGVKVLSGILICLVLMGLFAWFVFMEVEIRGFHVVKGYFC